MGKQVKGQRGGHRGISPPMPSTKQILTRDQVPLALSGDSREYQVREGSHCSCTKTKTSHNSPLEDAI